MESKTPEEVLRMVSADFKIQGYTRAYAAEKLGMKSKQTLSNLLSSKRYMSAYHARLFHDAFGYNVEFLIQGIGTLYPNNGSEAKDRMVCNKQSHHFVLMEESREDDVNQILYWVGEYFSKKDDQEGLALLATIGRFFQARKLVEHQMKAYKGLSEQSYKDIFEEKLCCLQSSILESIEDMTGITKKLRASI